MFDHLTDLKERNRGRAATGIGVSVLVHALLVVALVLGAESLTREDGEIDMYAREEGWEGEVPPPVLGGASGAAAPDAAPGAAGLDWSVSPLAEDPAVARAAPPPELRLPPVLRLGRPHPVRLVLPPSRVDPDSTLRVGGPAGAPREIRLSRARQATLHAPRALVEPHAPPLQLADSAAPTRWSWTVRPTEPGAQTLLLRLDAVVRVDGRDSVIALGALRREVVVRASLLQRASRFFAHHWTWIAPLAVAAAIAWLRERGRRRRETPAG